MNNALMFSSATDEWSTPQAFFDTLHAEFRFQWDAAATAENAKCGPYCYFGPDHSNKEYRDALTQRWREYRTEPIERLWLNPPYSRCREFIGKAAMEARNGALVVALVPPEPTHGGSTNSSGTTYGTARGPRLKCGCCVDG